MTAVPRLPTETEASFYRVLYRRVVENIPISWRVCRLKHQTFYHLSVDSPPVGLFLPRSL